MIDSSIKGPFFIRRMDSGGAVKAGDGPRESLPMVGFIYLTSGEILVEVDGRTFLCGPGHLMLIPENRSFAILHYSDAEGYKGGFRYLQFLGEPLQQAFWFDEAVFVGELFNMLAVSFSRNDLGFVEKGVELLLTRVKTSAETHLPDVVSSFLDGLFAKDKAIMSASDYAAGGSVSLNYLNRMVKKSTGRPVSAWIDIARLNRAKRLLSESSAPVIDIASAVGILDQAYFARFFRKHTGMTPSAYRKTMHE